ncbi:MAG: hypothetical protein ACLTS6_12850 [Anaerobutyricum sp.]
MLRQIFRKRGTSFFDISCQAKRFCFAMDFVPETGMGFAYTFVGELSLNGQGDGPISGVLPIVSCCI